MSPEAERLVEAAVTAAIRAITHDLEPNVIRDEANTRAALAAHIEALERRPHWMPIEDAPKDGTWIDLWAYPLSGGAGGRIPNAAWSAGAWCDQWSTSDGVPGPKIDMRITHFMAHAAPPAKDAT